MREVLSGKIHKATVTEANLEYEGSITIDVDLLRRVDLWAHQKVLVASITTGERLETYIMEGAAGSGMITMNGAAAHKIRQGEKVIIMGFELRDAPGPAPKCILLGEKNEFVRYIEDDERNTAEDGKSPD